MQTEARAARRMEHIRAMENGVTALSPGVERTIGIDDN